MTNNCQLLTANRTGFTLLEIIVTISIVTVAFFAITQVFPFSLKINKKSQNLTTAVFLAQAGLEQVLDSSYEDMGVGGIEPKARLSNDSASYLYHFQRETVAEYVDSILQTSVLDTGLKKVQTTVFWYDQMSLGEKSYTLTTLVVDN